jgi:hypothetical protein
MAVALSPVALKGLSLILEITSPLALELEEDDALGVVTLYDRSTPEVAFPDIRSAAASATVGANAELKRPDQEDLAEFGISSISSGLAVVDDASGVAGRPVSVCALEFRHRAAAGRGGQVPCVSARQIASSNLRNRNRFGRPFLHAEPILAYCFDLGRS